jgi:hypothetical protein
VKITNQFPGDADVSFKWKQDYDTRVHITATDGSRWEVAEDDGGHLNMQRIAYADGVNPLLTTAEQTVENIDAAWVALTHVTEVHGFDLRKYTDMTADEVRSMTALLGVAGKALSEARDVARRAANRAGMRDVSGK